jgi:outer membrane protein assembly factor BamB
LLWRAEGLGAGFASVTLSGGKAFTLGDSGGDTFVIALDRATGKRLWSVKAGKASGAGRNNGARSTPATDGRLLFALSQGGELVCVETRDGAEKWRRNLVKDFGGKAGIWGYCESPLLDGGRLIVTPGGAKSSMVCLDPATGKELWSCPANVAAGCASAVASTAGGVKQYVQFTNDGVIGVSAKDGSLLWRHDALARTSASAVTPLVLGDNVFVAAGFGKGGALLSLAAAGGGVAAKEVYLKKELQNKYGGVTAAGGLIFADTDSTGRPYCAEWRTGAVKWVRAPGSSKGIGSVSMTFADGHLYMLYENGHVALVPASEKAYTEAGSFQLVNPSREARAAPVVIGGRLYIRDGAALACYDVRGR